MYLSGHTGQVGKGESIFHDLSWLDCFLSCDSQIKQPSLISLVSY